MSDRLCSVSDIQDYFWYFIENHQTVTDNPPVRIYVNKIENRITFKIKIRYYLELLSPETMRLVWRTKSNINKDVNGKYLPHLEIIEVVLVHCNIVSNDYQQD